MSRRQLKELITNPALIPVTKHWLNIEKIDELPQEILVKIVIDHMPILLVLFEINSTLWAIPSKKGFWSSLFLSKFPQIAIDLSVTLLLEPYEELYDKFLPDNVMVKLSDVVKTEKEILSCDLSAVSSIVRNKMYPDEEPLPFTNEKNTITISGVIYDQFRFRIKKLVIASQVLSLNEIYEIYEGNESQDFTVRRSISFWLAMMKEKNMPRLKRYIVELQELDEELDRVCKIYENDTLKNQLYLNSPKLGALDEEFQAYFGLSDLDCRIYWKRLFIKMSELFDDKSHTVPLDLGSKQCSLCDKMNAIYTHMSLPVYFCGEECCSTFESCASFA